MPQKISTVLLVISIMLDNNKNKSNKYLQCTLLDKLKKAGKLNLNIKDSVATYSFVYSLTFSFSDLIFLQNDLGYIDVLCNGFKTCGVDSLVWRLAIVLAQALHNLGGGRAMAHLWYEFTQEMRYRWEKSIVLPG